jgi:hypothetical protein
LAVVGPWGSLALIGACSSVTVVGQQPSDGGGGHGGFIFLDGGGGDDTSDAGKDALPDYEDPGCKNKPPPIEDFLCDPYAQGNGDCGPLEGCYIYVDYPVEPCGQEVYGSFCAPQGSGQQGDGCNGGQDCAGGFVCVITGSGTQCVQLCNLEGADGCPPGFVCEPIDVEGFGGCL